MIIKILMNTVIRFNIDMYIKKKKKYSIIDLFLIIKYEYTFYIITFKCNLYMTCNINFELPTSNIKFEYNLSKILIPQLYQNILIHNILYFRIGD